MFIMGFQCGNGVMMVVKVRAQYYSNQDLQMQVSLKKSSDVACEILEARWCPSQIGHFLIESARRLYFCVVFLSVAF